MPPPPSEGGHLIGRSQGRTWGRRNAETKPVSCTFRWADLGMNSCTLGSTRGAASDQMGPRGPSEVPILPCFVSHVISWAAGRRQGKLSQATAQPCQANASEGKASCLKPQPSLAKPTPTPGRSPSQCRRRRQAKPTPSRQRGDTYHMGRRRGESVGPGWRGRNRRPIYQISSDQFVIGFVDPIPAMSSRKELLGACSFAHVSNAGTKEVLFKRLQQKAARGGATLAQLLRAGRPSLADRWREDGAFEAILFPSGHFR